MHQGFTVLFTPTFSLHSIVFDSAAEVKLGFSDWIFFLKIQFQDHVKEKLKLVQDFLHVDAQDQLTSLEEKMKSSEISMVSDPIRYLNH